MPQICSRWIHAKYFHITIILIISGILYLLGNADLAITDPVESNYALTAKEMLLNQNYFSPQIFNHYWYDKPIFYYVELIISYKLFGISNFGARFFSALLGVMNIGLLYSFVHQIRGKKTAVIAAILYATCAEFWIISKAIITDMTLVLFINITLMSFYIGYRKHMLHQKYATYYYIAYIGAALAVLTKGPIGFLLPGLIILIYLAVSHNLKELLYLKIPLGLLLLTFIGGSWYIYMYTMHGSNFINVFLGVHNWLRATVSEHPQFNVWYYYIIVTLIALFPWSFIISYKLYTQRKRLHKHNHITPFTIFLGIWALTVLIFFTCMATKYTTYTFPALAPMTILIAILCKPHYRFIRKAAILTVMLYGILTYTVAMPLMNHASSVITSQYILNTISDNAMIISARHDYRVSTTYYSNHTIYKLEATRDDSINPMSLSWDAKKIMPLAYANELPSNTAIYLLTDSDQFPNSLNKSEWTCIESNAEVDIYKHNK